jgi:biopolymer transport protein ExbD
MISQPLARQVMEIQVPPLEQAAASKAPSTQIVLELTVDGGYAINTQVVPKDQLATQIHAIFDNRPAKLLFIKSGPDRLYEEVIEAMDISRGAGIQVIGFTPKS